MAEIFLLLFVMSVVFGVSLIMSGIIGMLCSLFGNGGPAMTLVLIPVLFVALMFIAIPPLYNVIGTVVFSY